jgi:hypothetical protein
MDIASLKRSTVKVEGGDWVENIPEMGDLRLKVKGLGNAEYKAVFNRLARAVPKKDRERDGSLKDAVLHDVRGQALHKAVLIDWDKLSNGGKSVEFDSALALQWLTDSEFEDFQFAVIYAAGVVGKERDEAGDDLSKNSKQPSGSK